jgi:hypothetical protein
MLYVVTVKLAGTPGHDPLNKVTGECPLGDETCTDQTGKHHTFLVQTELSVEDVITTYANQYHVTRVETARHLEVL